MARKKTAAPPAPGANATAETVFRLKISLKYATPMIWRRIETPDCSLWDLHEIIQLCMPWENYHMWEFAVTRAERYGSEDDPEMGYHGADRVELSQLANRGVKKLTYVYDFGDSWDHVVTFEKPVARDPKAKYPQCIAGARACPPEDCGGFSGYENLLAILADRKHPDHQEMKEWVGRRIDPEAFNINAINARLRKLTPQ